MWMDKSDVKKLIIMIIVTLFSFIGSLAMFVNFDTRDKLLQFYSIVIVIAELSSCFWVIFEFIRNKMSKGSKHYKITTTSLMFVMILYYFKWAFLKY